MNAIGIEDTHILNAIGSFESGFGRMEEINVNGISLSIILVKNPAGFNQILNYLFIVDIKFILIIMLNDQAADGTDVSWIYDVAFEKLLDIHNKIEHIYIGGSRAYDMALRLKYADIDMSKVSIEQMTQTL
jgi:UDP-N-acetylmuramyl tripeptide synthase